MGSCPRCREYSVTSSSHVLTNSENTNLRFFFVILFFSVLFFYKVEVFKIGKKNSNKIVSRVFLLCQIWIVNYYVKNSLKIPSNIIGNEKKMVFPEKYFVLAFWFPFCLEDNRNTSAVFMFSLLRFFWLTFEVIIDNPYLTL